MFDLVPFPLKDEEARINKEITSKHLSVIFHGTSRLGEALAVTVCFVGGQEIAREIISVLLVTYGVWPELFLLQ